MHYIGNFRRKHIENTSYTVANSTTGIQKKTKWPISGVIEAGSFGMLKNIFGQKFLIFRFCHIFWTCEPIFINQNFKDFLLISKLSTILKCKGYDKMGFYLAAVTVTQNIFFYIPSKFHNFFLSPSYLFKFQKHDTLFWQPCNCNNY